MLPMFREQQIEDIKSIKDACKNNGPLFLPINFGLNFNTLSYF